jgi:phosphatidylglycerophosphate synthase
MDWTDGHVARYKKMTSKRGAFLDEINHCVTWPVLFVCIGLGLYLSTGEIFNVLFAFAAGMFMPLIMLTMSVYKSVNGDQIKESSENEDAEEKFFKNEKRFKRIRNINPLTFMNMYIVLLIVTLLDAILPEIFPSIFPFELFWMTGFLSLSVLFYGVGFPLGFFTRAGILYKRLT